MFGYVRARMDALSEEGRVRYEGAYCGLCHAMGRRYGSFSRGFLNYDFAFLAMLLAPTGTETGTERRRCARHPVHGREVCPGGDWMTMAAGESVILTWWKLRDTVADSGNMKGMGARSLAGLLSQGYRRARTDYPDFDARTAALLRELTALEREGCPSIDKTADCFARLLQAAAPSTGDAARERILGQLLYHLGRWIYLIDAVDDLAEDGKTGNYNPVGARFPEWTEGDRQYLRSNLDRSLELMGAAFQLLDANPYAEVLENIIYTGLPNVEELVFSGKWKERERGKLPRE